MNYVLELSNVWFKYEVRSPWVLRGIKLRVREGEVIFILGSNGVGKTTLLKVISGLLKPQRGVVKVMGKELNGVIPRFIGFSFQNPVHQFCFETVEDELSNVLRLNGYNDIESRVNETLELFGLEGVRRRSPFTLSSGEMRLLSIALAFIHNPLIMLLDEPFTNLDIDQIEYIVSLINRLRHQGRTLVITSTTQYEYVFELMGDVSTYILRNGELINAGTKTEKQSLMVRIPCT